MRRRTELGGKVVMITGAGRGIGASLARQMHRRGARLVLTDVDELGLRQLGAELGAEDVECVRCDVNDFDVIFSSAMSCGCHR